MVARSSTDPLPPLMDAQKALFSAHPAPASLLHRRRAGRDRSRLRNRRGDNLTMSRDRGPSHSSIRETRDLGLKPLVADL
jgi:hypothetical protein